MSDIEGRFWAKVEVGAKDECWVWSGATARRGYGTFAIRHGLLTPAHRFSWRLHKGEIPEGLCVLHHCDNPPCVNPAHLWLGTKADNSRDMVAKGRHGAHTGAIDNAGEFNGRAKLTEEQVTEIRRRRARGETQQAIADDFPVCRAMVGNIVRGEAWPSV